MKYLHESDVDVGTHANLQAVIDDIETQGSLAGTYCTIKQHPFREGNGIPIINATVEGYLTASEQSALEDTADQETPRNSDLPESETEMIILARFMDRYVEADFDIPDTPFPDHTYEPTWETSNEKTYQLWKNLPPLSGFPAEDFVKGFWYPSTNWVLSNIEDVGTIRMNLKETIPNWMGWWAHDFDYSGNPWHLSNSESNAKALKRRYMVTTFVDMIMLYNSGDTDHYRWQVYGMYGHMYDCCKDIMPPMVENAFVRLMQKMYFNRLESNHYGLQTTLDQIQRLGVLYLAVNIDGSIKNQWLDTFVTKSEYNFRQGKIANSSLDHDGGIDLEYQGRTDLFVSWAYAIAKKLVPDQATHMADWMNRFCEFQSYQVFPGPEAPIDRTYYGPSGVSVGTESDEQTEQDPSDTKYLNQAYHFGQDPDNHGLYNAWRYDGSGPSPMVPSVTMMQTDIQDDLGNINQFWFDETKKTTALFPAWTKTSTPPDLYSIGFKYQQADEYTFLSGKKNDLTKLYVEDVDLDDIKIKFQRSTDFIKAFDKEFLAAKLASGTSNEWGCQIYTNDLGFRGSIATPVGDTEIAGFRGGVSGIWHKTLGVIMISRMRGQQQDTQNDRLDASVSAGFYAGWTSWCDNHLGGRTAEDEIFTTAFHGRSYDEVNKTYTVNGTTDFTVIASDDLTPMREAYAPLAGQVDFTLTFSGDSSGLTVTKELTADAIAQGQNIDELWEFLPLVIRSKEETSAWDRTIEISTNGGSTYSAPTLDTILTGIDVIRISRSGTNCYIVPDATQHPDGWDMQFDGTLWQTGDNQGMVRIARVDLHGNSGSPIAFPASTTVKWKFQPTAPA